MRRTIYALLMAFGVTSTASAQVDDGYYHIQNKKTGRYISLSDTDPSNYDVSIVSGGSINLAGLRTYKDYERVATSPSCVIFVRHIEGNSYDLIGQGTSLYSITGGFYATITGSGDTYKMSGSHKGVTLYLSDLGSTSREEGWLTTDNEDTRDWKFIPIDDNSQYIGIKPDVKIGDGSYCGSIYAGFNFRLASSGMTAYYVSDISETHFRLKEITDEVIPAGMPVIVKCSSEVPSDNKILPMAGIYTPASDNRLGGVYCALYGVAKHQNVSIYYPTTMRIIGESNGQLAFVQATADRLYQNLYLPANKAYLNVASNCVATMLDVSTAINTIEADDTTDDNAIYTLTGVRLPEGAAKHPGIYIRNGKKFVIR